MMIFQFICGAVFFAMLGYFVYVMWDSYKNDPNKADFKQKWFAMGAGYATKAWLRLVGVIASGLSGLSFFAEALQLPQVTDALNKYLPPQYLTPAILVIALIGLFSRSRSSSDNRYI